MTSQVTLELLSAGEGHVTILADVARTINTGILMIDNTVASVVA